MEVSVGGAQWTAAGQAGETQQVPCEFLSKNKNKKRKTKQKTEKRKKTQKQKM